MNLAAPQVESFTTAQQIDRLFSLRERKRELNELIKEIDAQFEETKAQLIAKLEAEGTPSARSMVATATITRSTVPNVVEWDAFYQYIKDNDALYLLERRPSVSGCRELFQAGETLPGVEPFEKVDLSLTKLRVTK